MKIRAILLLALALTYPGSLLAGAESNAQADFEATEKLAKEAEAAAAPAKKAADQAVAALASAEQTAAMKRQQAEEAKKKVADRIASQQMPAETNLAAAVQAAADVAAQKKMADEALAAAKAQVTRAAEALPAAEQAAQAAEVNARPVALSELAQVAGEAVAKRKTADEAQAALTQAQQNEQQAQTNVNAAATRLMEAGAEKKAADEALADANNQVTVATGAQQAAEKAAQDSEAQNKAISEDASKNEADKKLAADDAAAKRKAAEEAKVALAQAQQNQQPAQTAADTAAAKLSEAEMQKKVADEALAAAKTQVSAATGTAEAAATAAQISETATKEIAARFARSAEVQQQAVAEAAAKRKAADDAKVAVAEAQKNEQQAQAQATMMAQKSTEAAALQKSAEDALTNVKNQVATTTQAQQMAERAALEAATAVAAAKAVADNARTALAALDKTAADKRALANLAKAAYDKQIGDQLVANVLESPVPPKPANPIDEIVFAKLKSLGIEPVLCADAVFVRRACLDLTGKLPTAEDAKAFIQNPDPNKRVALIDRLLDQPAHVDYWAMKWSDILRIKAEFPVKLWPNAAQAYHRWVWDSIARNKPYDQFARELLTSSGSNFRVGPVNFYRAIQNRTPEGIAAAAGLALMGTRVDLWPAERRAGVAAFFSQIGYKPTSEWKEEIVFWDPLHSTTVTGCNAPGAESVAGAVTATNQIAQALTEPLVENGPLAAVFPDGSQVTIPPHRDPREVFAEWLIRPENPWFTRAIVDRTWAWVMGRGIIHEPDDIREDNPATNPELLAYLEKELIAHGYDVKYLKRLIFTSTTYQFSSVPRFAGPEAAANFASYRLRRVEAEVLIDALAQITGSPDLYTSAVPEPFTYIPKDMPAVAMADGSITSSFLTLFGRSARATGMESERVNELASPQWLHMLNSGQIQDKFQNGPKLLAMINTGGKTNEIAERIYLSILSRFPTDVDLKAAEEYAKAGVAKGRDVWIDLAWALINSPEFLMRH